eukprot:CAMPEP_0194136152 /NCGR_PEP_ID=MMETSP0152-20130528/6167_1 /TAXON_ID=1049557 /ORGANISM="Thalassiothrix antarctica, Strain L6-D1" /LENGTH=190 /DNA_ID=CAMNT_0038832679 /DNA_START=414 /DNA_END=989 /DNA_ORIENTATION=+
MTDEEIDATWLTVDEKKKFRREASMTKKIIHHQQSIKRGPRLNNVNEKSIHDNLYSDNSEVSRSLNLSFSYSSSYDDDDDEVEVLESYKRGLEARQQRIIGMSRRVVFEEQERQHAILRKQRRRCLQETRNRTNFEQEKENMIQRGQKMIATRYRSITEDASILARQRARQDSNDVAKSTTTIRAITEEQ